MGSAAKVVTAPFKGIGNIFSGIPKGPEVPKPEPLAELPTGADPRVAKARETIRRRAASAVGRDETILTSPLGLPLSASIGRKSLLGA